MKHWIKCIIVVWYPEIANCVALAYEIEERVNYDEGGMEEGVREN